VLWKRGFQEGDNTYKEKGLRKAEEKGSERRV